MQLFPKLFDTIDPGITRGLKQPLELRITRQKTAGDMAFMNDVVVEDNDNAPDLAAGFSQGGAQDARSKKQSIPNST